MDTSYILTYGLASVCVAHTLALRGVLIAMRREDVAGSASTTAKPASMRSRSLIVGGKPSKILSLIPAPGHRSCFSLVALSQATSLTCFNVSEHIWTTRRPVVHNSLEKSTMPSLYSRRGERSRSRKGAKVRRRSMMRRAWICDPLYVIVSEIVRYLLVVFTSQFFLVSRGYSGEEADNLDGILGLSGMYYSSCLDISHHAIMQTRTFTHLSPQSPITLTRSKPHPPYCLRPRLNRLNAFPSRLYISSTRVFVSANLSNSLYILFRSLQEEQMANGSNLPSELLGQSQVYFALDDVKSFQLKRGPIPQPIRVIEGPRKTRDAACVVVHQVAFTTVPGKVTSSCTPIQFIPRNQPQFVKLA